MGELGAVDGFELSRLNRSRPIKAALAYGRLSWPVFPIAPVDRQTGKCGCREGSGCDQVGKHPMVRWTERATTDAIQIREFWCWLPQANIGIVTGQRSGLIVVDIDRQHGGLETREELARKGLVFPPTLAARTRSGGWHLFYSAPAGQRVANTEGMLAGVGKTPGIDVRGDGGYAILAPSVRPSPEGGLATYSWVAQEYPLVEAPSWVTVPKASRTSHLSVDLRETVTSSSRRAEAALTAEVRRVCDAGDGSRNQALFEAAGNLFEIVNTGFLDEHRVRSELLYAGLAAGLAEGEIVQTLDSQWHRKQGVRRKGWTTNGPDQGRLGRPFPPNRDSPDPDFGR